MKEPGRKIISASRREDMVAHSPDRLAAIISGTAGGRFAGLNPSRIHSLVIWTRDFRNLLFHRPLKIASAQCGQVYVHLTVTGLAGSFLEPGCQKPEELMPYLDDLIDFVGTPERICLRYDPLISVSIDGKITTNMDIGIFERVASPFSVRKVPRVVTSIVSAYPKAIARLQSVPGPDLVSGQAFIASLERAACKLGMTLDTCCFPPGSRGCIDAALLETLHPEHEAVPNGAIPSQRIGCRCCSSWDIGWYRPCPAGCLYCYAR